jgi:two-component system, chemotaxis family, protein-glutamate methylesterase/glutaminase
MMQPPAAVPRPSRNTLRVLVVDDSAVVRQAVAAILSQEPGLEVTAASDPLIAMDKMRKSRPDVILLDLQMPRMDGLTFLRKIMSEDPIPVVICSAWSAKGSEAALRALEQGAVDIVTKPRVGVREFLWESAVLLVDTLRAASVARLPGRWPPAPRVASVPTPTVVPARNLARAAAGRLIALGASTGGTEALRTFLEAMPENAPPIVVVQHMPEGFTRAFADRLDKLCAISVREASSGDVLRGGEALIAPGNHHLEVRRARGHHTVSVHQGPLVSRHRPSVDVLFRSVAKNAGAAATGVILTGMGDDGADGLLAMREAGAATLAQDEATCVVFGMPKEAIACGAVQEVLPLGSLAAAALRSVGLAPR